MPKFIVNKPQEALAVFEQGKFAYYLNQNGSSLFATPEMMNEFIAPYSAGNKGGYTSADMQAVYDNFGKMTVPQKWRYLKGSLDKISKAEGRQVTKGEKTINNLLTTTLDWTNKAGKAYRYRMWVASGWYLGYQSLMQYQLGRRGLAKGVLDELGKDYVFKFAQENGFLGQGIIGAVGNDITKGPVRNYTEQAGKIAADATKDPTFFGGVRDDILKFWKGDGSSLAPAPRDYYNKFSREFASGPQNIADLVFDKQILYESFQRSILDDYGTWDKFNLEFIQASETKKGAMLNDLRTKQQNFYNGQKGIAQFYGLNSSSSKGFDAAMVLTNYMGLWGFNLGRNFLRTGMKPFMGVYDILRKGGNWSDAGNRFMRDFMSEEFLGMVRQNLYALNAKLKLERLKDDPEKKNQGWTKDLTDFVESMGNYSDKFAAMMSSSWFRMPLNIMKRFGEPDIGVNGDSYDRVDDKDSWNFKAYQMQKDIFREVGRQWNLLAEPTKLINAISLGVEEGDWQKYVLDYMQGSFMDSTTSVLRNKFGEMYTKGFFTYQFPERNNTLYGLLGWNNPDNEIQSQAYAYQNYLKQTLNKKTGLVSMVSEIPFIGKGLSFLNAGATAFSTIKDGERPDSADPYFPSTSNALIELNKNGPLSVSKLYEGEYEQFLYELDPQSRSKFLNNALDSLVDADANKLLYNGIAYGYLTEK